MAIDLKSLRKVKADQPARILIYAPPGYGKTTLASEFPAPVFLQVEDGTPGGLELDSFGLLKSFNDVMDALQSLYEGEHDFQTLVVDSVTELQRLVFDETCARGDDNGNPKKGIEDFGYGKGYVKAQTVWQEFIDALNMIRLDRQMTIILIAHSKIDRFDDPETVSYHRYEIDLHDRSVGIIERDMDAILLLKKSVAIKEEDQGFNKKRATAKSGGSIMINAVPNAAFVAKNRYDIPAILPFDKGKGYAALAPFLPTQAAK